MKGSLVRKLPNYGRMSTVSRVITSTTGLQRMNSRVKPWTCANPSFNASWYGRNSQGCSFRVSNQIWLVRSVRSFPPSVTHWFSHSFFSSFLPAFLHQFTQTFTYTIVCPFTLSAILSFMTFGHFMFLSEMGSFPTLIPCYPSFNSGQTTSSTNLPKLRAKFMQFFQPSFILRSFLPSFLNYPKFLHFLIFHLFPESGVIHSIIFFRQCFHVRAPPAHHASRFL